MSTAVQYLEVEVAELHKEIDRLIAAVSYRNGDVKVRCDCKFASGGEHHPLQGCKCGHNKTCPVHILLDKEIS